MKALILNDQRALELVEHAIPVLEQDHDVIVRIVQTGICGTDRSILVGKFSARPGTILGHESVGYVHQVGKAVNTLQPGQRVIINPTLYCSHCTECLEGRLNFCLNKKNNEVGVDRHGAFAEYIRLPEQFCHPIPKGMSFDRAVMVEPLACALNNIKATRLRAGEQLVVIGGGPMGLVCAMLAVHCGVATTVLESDSYRLLAIRSLFEGQPLLRVEDPVSFKGSALADVVIDTVGNQLDHALTLVRTLGRVAILGYHDHCQTLIRPLDLVMKGISIMGAGDYNSHDFPKALRLAEHLPLEKLISARYPLQQFEKAFDALSSSGQASYTAMKVLLTIDPPASEGAPRNEC